MHGKVIATGFLPLLHRMHSLDISYRVALHIADRDYLEAESLRLQSSPGVLRPRECNIENLEALCSGPKVSESGEMT